MGQKKCGKGHTHQNNATFWGAEYGSLFRVQINKKIRVNNYKNDIIKKIQLSIDNKGIVKL